MKTMKGWANLTTFVIFLTFTISAGAQDPAEVRVRIETSFGQIDLAIDTKRAPVTSANFLKYVDAGLYDGGRFHRATRPDNYKPVPPNRPPMELIQGGINPDRREEGFPPIPLERTSVTGLKHVVGIVSMARVPGDPDSATGQIVIALGPDSAGTLKESATAFGVLTAGAEVLSELAGVAVGSRRLDDPRSPRDRPIASLVIERAWAEPAPLTAMAPRPESPAPAPAIER